MYDKIYVEKHWKAVIRGGANWSHRLEKLKESTISPRNFRRTRVHFRSLQVLRQCHPHRHLPRLKAGQKHGSVVIAAEAFAGLSIWSAMSEPVSGPVGV